LPARATGDFWTGKILGRITDGSEGRRKKHVENVIQMENEF